MTLPLLLEQQALTLQSKIESQLSLREHNLQTKISSLLSSVDSKILRIKSYHKSLLSYEKELQNLCFSTMDVFEEKIKELEYLLDTETTNLLTSLTQNIGISVSNTYFSLLQELKSSFQAANFHITSLDFSNFRPHFSSMFETFEIEIPREFIDTANIMEDEVNKAFKQTLSQLKDHKPIIDSSTIKKHDFNSEEDDIDKKMRLMEEKVEGGPQSLKRNKNLNPEDKDPSSKGKTDPTKHTGGILSKVKAIFTKKKTAERGDFDETATATEMKLGDDSKFRYDPIKKKYIFEGEEELPEEIIPPPIMSTTKSANIKPKDTSSKEALLQPPARNYLRGKKEESKKPIEKFSVFTPNTKPEVIKPEVKPIENKKKNKYSEGISLHFEKILRQMKEKINGVLESRVLKNNEFYSELKEDTKGSWGVFWDIFQGDLKPYFEEKMKGLIEEQKGLERTMAIVKEEKKENFMRDYVKNKGKNERDFKETLCNLSTIIVEKNRENISLEGSLIHLQNRYFGLLNENLYFLISSKKKEEEDEEKFDFGDDLKKIEEISHIRIENQKELIEFFGDNLNENKNFYDEIIDKLLKRMDIVLDEKKGLYEIIKTLLKVKTVYEEEKAGFLNEIENLKRKYNEKTENLNEKTKELEKINQKIVSFENILKKTKESEFALNKSLFETEEKLSLIIKEKTSFEKENQNLSDFIEKGEEINKVLNFLSICEEFPTNASLITRLKLLLMRVLSKSEEILQSKEWMINNLTDELAQIKDRIEEQNQYHKTEVGLKEDLIVIKTEEINTLTQSLKSNIIELEALNFQNNDWTLKRTQILSDLQQSNSKINELLSENTLLESKSKELTNENLSLSNELAHVNQILNRIDKEMAERVADLRSHYNLIEEENLQLKKQLNQYEKIINETQTQKKSFESELNDSRIHIAELNKKITNIIQKTDIKGFELQNMINHLEDEKNERNNQLSYEIIGLNERISRLILDNKKINEVCYVYKEENERLTSENGFFSNEINAKIVENNELQLKINKLTENLQNMSQGLLERSQQYNEKLLQEQNLFSNSQSELETERKNQQSLNNEIIMLKNEINNLKTEVPHYNEEILNLKAEITKYIEQTANFNNEKALLNERESGLMQELKVLKENMVKNFNYEEAFDKIKGENEDLRITLLKQRDNEAIIQELQYKLTELQQTNEEFAIERTELIEINKDLIENKLKEYENTILNLSKEIKELKKENESLKTEKYEENNKNFNSELETLQKVLEKKSKRIEQLEQNEREMGKNIENQKKNEAKIKEIEDFNNVLTSEKRKLLEENDRLYTQLIKKDFYEELVVLKQKLKNIEEEKTLLKANNDEIIDKLNRDIIGYKDTIENLKTNLEKIDNNKEKTERNNENSNNTTNISKIATIDGNNTNIGDITGKDKDENKDNNKQGGGLMYNIASFFLTDKELKNVKK